MKRTIWSAVFALALGLIAVQLASEKFTVRASELAEHKAVLSEADGSRAGSGQSAGQPGQAAQSARSNDTPRVEGAVVISRNEIQKLLGEKLPGPAIYGGGLIDGEHFRMGALRRKAPGKVEIHRDDTDIFYILAGEATIVTGGTAINAKKMSEKETIAESIKGGVSHELHAGDVMVIPKQTPHWFQQVTSGIEYIVIKVQ